MLISSQSQQLVYLALIYFLSLSTNLVNALPLSVRQNGATTVQTVHTTQTNAGPLTETCVITLTPITDENGQPAVEEVKKCSLAYGGSGTGDAGGGSASSSSTTFTTVTAGDTALPPATGTVIGTSTSLDTSTATGTSTVVSTGVSTSSGATSLASSTALPASGVRVNGLSTVSDVPTGTGSTASILPTTTPSTTTPTVTDAGTAAPDANTPPSSASAAASEQSSGSFQLPGKKLSVLPIGLGVFAGISVIALIVVGLVTYERTKYRKAFRARKLAESGATMGYGGMAERS